MNNASLKEYYISLQKMYKNAINILNGIDKSLSTSSPEIEVPIINNDGSTSTVRIPSYLYLENKLEELNSNFDILFNMPESGEAYLTKDSEEYKINLIRANTAPIKPIISDTVFNASIKSNNMFKDLVSPKTYIRMYLNNIPSNVEDVIMKKIVIYDSNVFSQLSSDGGRLTYAECKEKLDSLTPGKDYEEYESTIKMPTKSDLYISDFKITKIIGDTGIYDYTVEKVRYELVLDTLNYYNSENSAIIYTLKENDLLALGNTSTVYRIIDVNNVENKITVEEYVGHSDLMTYEQNSEMTFKILNNDYSKYSFADIPLEENRYIVVFISSVWNNIRSEFSEGIVFDLSTVMMVDSNGNPISNSAGIQYNYVDYYNKFVENIGDFITSISECAYSQLGDYTPDEIETLFVSSDVKNLVSSSINTDTVLKVVPINKHINDDLASEDIINLHNQKNEILAKLQTCSSNIDQVYSTMLTTDFSQNPTVSQVSLQEKIQEYYTERTSLQKQLNAIIDNINVKSDSVNVNKTKYRIRGITDISLLNDYIKKYNNLDVVGIDIQYK